MDKKTSKHILDLDIRLIIGNYYINILNLSYEAPNSCWGYKNHSHSSYELHFISEGCGVLKYAGDSLPLSPNTFYLTGPNIFHEQEANATNPMNEYSLNFEINPLPLPNKKNITYIKEEIDSIITILKSTNFFIGKYNLYINNLFEKIFDELENEHLGYYMYTQTLITEIIINTVRLIPSSTQFTYTIPTKLLNDSRRLLIDDYFRDFEKNLSPKDLANIIGVTERQLERILLKYYQTTFKNKLTTLRLKESKKLLLNSSLSVSDISKKVGFSSPAYFSKVFYKYYNVSPTKYRVNKQF